MSDEKCTCPKDEIPWHNNPDCPVLKAESSFAAPTLLDGATCDSQISDLDIILFAAQHARRIVYGPPAKLEWQDARGDHETLGVDTRDAHIRAILEWRSTAPSNTELIDRRNQPES